jgi:hypothetical protein
MLMSMANDPLLFSLIPKNLTQSLSLTFVLPYQASTNLNILFGRNPIIHCFVHLG